MILYCCDRITVPQIFLLILSDWLYLLILAVMTYWKKRPKWFHVIHAVFFPLTAKSKTWSHPVNAWKSGRHFDFSGPRAAVILCISIYFEWFPVPIASQSSNKFSCPNKLIDIATTSVSTVQISTFFIPDWLASVACNNILVSTSSWFEGAINDRASFDYL